MVVCVGVCFSELKNSYALHTQRNVSALPLSSAHWKRKTLLFEEDLYAVTFFSWNRDGGR